MKKIVLFTLMIISKTAFSQYDERLPVAFLKYFNEIESLNLNCQILIEYENELFVCNEFMEKTKIQPINRLRYRLKLTKLTPNKFSFKFDISSQYTGVFELLKEDEWYYFILSNCVERTE